MDDINVITGEVIRTAVRVHRGTGPGLLESVYQACMVYELVQSGLAIEAQRPLPVSYRDVRLECGYRIDLVVENRLIVEVKAVEHLAPVHFAQMITYLKLSGCTVGLILNFNVPVLKQGIRRIVLGHDERRTAGAPDRETAGTGPPKAAPARRSGTDED